MRRNLIHVVLALAVGGLLGCAAVNKTGESSGMTAADIATQAEGVAKALETLPKAPGDKATQEQIENYAAWGAFLAKTAAAVVGAAS